MRWVAESCGRRRLLFVFGMMVVAGVCLGRLPAQDRKSGFTEHLLGGAWVTSSAWATGMGRTF